MAVGVGFAWLLALVLGVAGWRHVAGKVTAIGAVILGGLAIFVVWQQFRHPTSELDGTWQAVRYESADGTSDNVAASWTRLRIAGEKLKHVGPYFGGMLGEIDGFITIDATQNPKTFDAGGSRVDDAPGNATLTLDWSGIYEIEGDTLKLCFRGGKDERPKEFKSNPALLVVLRRVKQ